ncbi:MAG: response regulator [Deltaproteobacteria bacterium]|nr:response regulator [Deltaproteobacteria bacterium]
MLKILVVDDEEDVLSLTRIMLESKEYSVTTANGGEEALTIIANDKPDLVLLDIVMPGVHGLDVCRTLKRDESTRHIPVIMFTALGPSVDLMLAEEDKAEGYIGEPFTSKTLLDLVERLLKKEIV